MGDGVYEALWKLTLAMFLKGIITVFTFGIKVRAVWLSVLVEDLGLTSSSAAFSTTTKLAPTIFHVT